MWTSEQIAKAARAVTSIGEEAVRLNAELESELGSNYARLINSPEVDEAAELLEKQAQNSHRESEPSDETPTPTPTGEYDLLPFPNMSLKKDGDPIPIVGYTLDEFCRPHGTGARRKGGPLNHRHYWQGKKFRSGYRITVDNRRIFKPDWWFAMARTKAEALRRQEHEWD
jgi:hypothetical protein